MLHLHMVRDPAIAYNGGMELIACFAAFALLVAGWLASGKRLPAAD
jgi:hypothetical protein